MTQKKFTYFEELYPDVMKCGMFEDDAFIASKGYKLARGLQRCDSEKIYCTNCNIDIAESMDEIDQYAICPVCGSVLVDIDY